MASSKLQFLRRKTCKEHLRRKCATISWEEQRIKRQAAEDSPAEKPIVADDKMAKAARIKEIKERLVSKSAANQTK